MNSPQVTFPPPMSAWHYESDGEPGSRTHYAWRHDATKPTGTDRIDFPSRTAARAFAMHSNKLIFDILNHRN